MQYLYHQVRNNMQGEILYPLNVLKDVYPELYKSIIPKYEGRTDIMQQPIFPLGCVWNDVIHLTAVHPQDLKNALVAAGMKNYPMRFYQINPNSLSPKDATVFLYNRSGKVLKTIPEDFVVFDPLELEKYSVIPEVTREYYRECFASKTLPLMFARVPHIFYKGTINISDVPIIEV